MIPLRETRDAAGPYRVPGATAADGTQWQRVRGGMPPDASLRDPRGMSGPSGPGVPTTRGRCFRQFWAPPIVALVLFRPLDGRWANRIAVGKVLL